MLKYFQTSQQLQNFNANFPYLLEPLQFTYVDTRICFEIMHKNIIQRQLPKMKTAFNTEIFIQLPNVQDAFQPMPGLISCPGVTMSVVSMSLKPRNSKIYSKNNTCYIRQYYSNNIKALSMQVAYNSKKPAMFHQTLITSQIPVNYIQHLSPYTR